MLALFTVLADGVTIKIGQNESAARRFAVGQAAPDLESRWRRYGKGVTNGVPTYFPGLQD